jgi:hypothetical protein
VSCFVILVNSFVAANKTTRCLKSFTSTLTASLRTISLNDCVCFDISNVLDSRKDSADKVSIAEVSGALITMSTSSVEVGVCAVHIQDGETIV